MAQVLPGWPVSEHHKMGASCSIYEAQTMLLQTNNLRTTWNVLLLLFDGVMRKRRILTCFSQTMHICGKDVVLLLQTNNLRTSWDAVWMAPEEIAKEGIMISPHLLDDHYTVTLEVSCQCMLMPCLLAHVMHTLVCPDMFWPVFLSSRRRATTRIS